MRLRKLKNASQVLHSRLDIFVPEPMLNKGKWSKVFANNNPIHLEIGMGKGKFIIEHAQKHPDINYIGLEIEQSVIAKAVRKIENNIPNLYLINYDANFIKEVFDENEIDKIFLNFSDPWPKNRHAKRRLTEKTFLDNYASILKDQGTIEFKTDNRKLFEFSLLEFVARKWDIVNMSLNLHEDGEDIITTEYEDKFINAGQIIYFIEVKNGKNETL